MFGILLALAGFQVAVTLREHDERRSKYQEAVAYCKTAGKLLLVVGGPYGGVSWMKAHGCGDVCLDINPWACRGCETVVADIREIPFPDGKFGAAYVSHILEHLPTIEDARRAVGELYRVSDKVFVCGPGKLNLHAWLMREHHLWVKQDNDTIWVQQR